MKPLWYLFDYGGASVRLMPSGDLELEVYYPGEGVRWERVENVPRSERPEWLRDHFSMHTLLIGGVSMHYRSPSGEIVRNVRPDDPHKQFDPWWDVLEAA
jgi:hypothetical protein